MNGISPSNSVGSVAGRFGQPGQRQHQNDDSKPPKKQPESKEDDSDPKAEAKPNGVGENIDIEA